VAPRRCHGGRARACVVSREVDGEDSEFARDIRVRGGVLTADADVSLAVVKDRGAKELVARRRGDRERGNDEGTRAISVGLGDEGVEEEGREVGEEGLAVKLGAAWATGAQSGTVKPSSTSARGSA
jgi:hypothetical protein